MTMKLAGYLSVALLLFSCVTVVLWVMIIQSGTLKLQSLVKWNEENHLWQNVTITSGFCNCSMGFPLLQTDSSILITCNCPAIKDVSNCTQNATSAISKDKIICPQCLKEPWFARGRVWHYPVRLPRCSMDSCFNYSKCTDSEEMMIYTYDRPADPPRYFSGIKQSQWHTGDPHKACIFFVFFDTPGIFRPQFHPSDLPYWNGGLNHVLISFADKWDQKGPAQESIGLASIMASDLHQTTSRPGFDVSISLPANVHFRHLQSILPDQRKYLLTFRGLRYVTVGMDSEGCFRSHESFRGMHNGHDIIVATSCRHPVNDEHRLRDPSLGAHCHEDDANYNLYGYADLMNSTFGLVPAGISPNSYRFAEVLSAGAIPILIADNYVKPFDTLVQWHRCILQFPTAEMHHIVSIIRSMNEKNRRSRQKYCIEIYDLFFKDGDALLGASINSLKARFMGVVPSSFFD